MADGSKSGFLQAAQNAGFQRLVSYALQTIGGIVLSVLAWQTKNIIEKLDELGTRTTKLEVKREADDKETASMKSEIKDSLLKIERQIEKLSDKITRTP